MAMPKYRTLTYLKNIGDKLSSRLNEVGIYSEDELREIGAVNAHEMIQNRYPEEKLPICYYLYSFDGAISNIHWNDIDSRRKKALKKAIE